MLNLDINVLIELYWGTDPAWNGYELAKFFNCGYQSIYNFMDKLGVPRRDKSETQANNLKSKGVRKQLSSKCPDCRIILEFSKWINSYRYLFHCLICDKLFYLNVKGRVTKLEDREKVDNFKEIANKLDDLCTEGKGLISK